MTAEIAIMNKEAIALATDSAVTMGQKVFISANKLFALSKYRPVGIMVYGNASFMGIPWESIIKTHRNKLGEQKFDTLEKYADEFISFLDNGNPLFPETEQKKHLSEITLLYFGSIKGDIEKRAETIVEEKGEISKGQVRKIVSDVIEDHLDRLKNTEILPSIPENHARNTIRKYGNAIDKIRKEVFEELPLSPSMVNKLRNIGASLFSKDMFRVNASGVVIAGFGEKDIFPSLKSFDIEGVLNNRLKHREGSSGKINFENAATIIPFAEEKMVAIFMEGIDPDFQTQIENDLSEMFGEYPEIIVESIQKFDDSEKKELKKKLKKISNEILEDYQEQMATYRRRNYVDPVINVVSMLPKDELAGMAEALVSLTSLKRKVTTAAETVGGPIDVAVISKGDGFIWVKRKHYFKAELNPQFFSN